jgi:hypothetical protein
LAVVFTAAILSRDKSLRFAMTMIVIAWFFTRLWRMTLPQYNFGYAGMDAFLGAAFFLYWRGERSFIIIPLIAMQLIYLALHAISASFDLSGIYFGALRSDSWVEAFWRNRLFEITLFYILMTALFRLAIMHSTYARKLLASALGRWFGSSMHRALSQLRVRAESVSKYTIKQF